MQVNNFIKYLDNSSLMATLPENEIAPLLEKFPYCQTGQMMHTICLNKNNSILFNQQLKRAASYCTDRIKLFEHLHNEQLQVSKKEKPQFKPTSNQVSEKKNVQNLDALEKEYLTAAVSSSIFLDSEEAVGLKEKDRTAETEQEKIIEVNLFDTKKEHSFSEWLKHYNGDEVSENNDEPSLLSKQTKQDLIDRFIQEDPKIQPQKTEFYSPTNMARLSVVDDSDIVSETLALIYVDQGKYQEAIKAYEKLILTIPEKRSYFASQIKILNEKLKQ